MGAECNACGKDVFDGCDYCAVVSERDAIKQAARRLLGAYQAGEDLVVHLNTLEDACGFTQQGHDTDNRPPVQISTMLVMAAAEDPTVPDEGPVKDLLQQLADALGGDSESAAVLVVTR